MALYRRGPVWYMEFYYEGKQYRRSTGTSDPKLAQRILDKVKGQIAENRWFEHAPGENRTVQHMLERYLTDHSAPNKAPATHRRDKSLVAHLTHAFGDRSLAQMRPALLAGYKAERRRAGASPKTINDELGLLGHAYKLAMREWEWTDRNPVERVSKEKVRNQIERWLTADEERRLLAASPEWLREILRFALHTGLRQGEILKLQWPQVDLARRTLTILEQKNGYKDTLPLNATALEVLQARAKVRSIKTECVFFNEAGHPRDARNLLRAFYTARTAAKITGFRFHDLRHSWATRLVQNGVDLYTVQKLGRWRTLSMVLRYAHHSTETLRPGIEVLDRLRTQTSTKQAQSVEEAGAVPPQGIERIGAPGRN